MEPIKVKIGDMLRFQVDIQGASAPVNEVRFTIKNNDKKISYLGEYKGGVAKFNIMDLAKFVNPNQNYFCELEIFIGGQHFAPFSGLFEFVEMVEVKANMIQEESHGSDIAVKIIEDKLPVNKQEKRKISTSSIVEDILFEIFGRRKEVKQ